MRIAILWSVLLLLAAPAAAQETKTLAPDAGVFSVEAAIAADEEGRHTVGSIGVVLDDGTLLGCTEAAPDSVVTLSWQVERAQIDRTATVHAYSEPECQGSQSEPAVSQSTGEEVTLTFELLPPPAPRLQL